MKEPRITVLMAVYNGERYLKEAVASTLDQSFADFEFLVINDRSTDRSGDIIRSYHDPRIRLVENLENIGLTASLYKGFTLANGEFIARIDADDVSRPKRLACQVAFMDAHPEVGVCGSWVRFFPDGYVWKLPATHEEIRCRQFCGVGVAHPSVMLRKRLFHEHGLNYNPACRYAQDYELWGRAINHMKFANIQKVLVDYRVSPGQVCARHRSEQLAAAAPIRLQRVRELGLEPTADEWQLHQMIIDGLLPKESQYLGLAEQWLLKLQFANKKAGIYQEDIFSKKMLDFWFATCLALSEKIKNPCRRCFTSPLWSVANASAMSRTRALGAWLLQSCTKRT